MTGLEIINDSLLLNGVIYPGQTISPEALATSQLGLNNMLSEWNAQGLAVFSIVKSTFSLSNGTADYTIGSGATINQARPEKIEAWRVYDSSGAANGGQPVDSKEFVARADDNALTAARIEMLNYDAAFPVGTIHLYPIPNGGTLELWVWEQLAAITDFTLAISFPPGYLKTIIYNLAVDLAPKFGREVGQTVKMVADAGKATLGGTNSSELTRVPPEKRGAQPLAPAPWVIGVGSTIPRSRVSASVSWRCSSWIAVSRNSPALMACGTSFLRDLSIASASRGVGEKSGR